MNLIEALKSGLEYRCLSPIKQFSIFGLIKNNPDSSWWEKPNDHKLFTREEVLAEWETRPAPSIKINREMLEDSYLYALKRGPIGVSRDGDYFRLMCEHLGI